MPEPIIFLPIIVIKNLFFLATMLLSISNIGNEKGNGFFEDHRGGNGFSEQLNLNNNSGGMGNG